VLDSAQATEFAATLKLAAPALRLLTDPDGARDIGRAAHVSVRDRYLAPCFLTRYLKLALSVH